jgi:hypothetical protein
MYSCFTIKNTGGPNTINGIIPKNKDPECIRRMNNDIASTKPTITNKNETQKAANWP